MSRRKNVKLNTDNMFYGCSSLDASRLSFHTISPYVSSMERMFYGAAIPKSQSFDGENIKFNSLVRCKDAFKNSGFAFSGTYMQFYGTTGNVDGRTEWVSSVGGMFSGNSNISDSAPTVILSKNASLTSESAIASALDCRFATYGVPSGNVSDDIYSTANSSLGIYDFSSLYANTSISSVEMRGICNCLAASSVIGNAYVARQLGTLTLCSFTPSVSAGGWEIRDVSANGFNSLACLDVPEQYRGSCVTIFKNCSSTETVEGEGVSEPHIRKMLKLDYGFGDGPFTLSFKYKFDKGSDTIGFDHVKLRISDGVNQDDSLKYVKFSVNGANGVSNEVSYFDGNTAATEDSDGWYDVSYSCESPTDVRIVVWNSSPTYFENVFVSNIKVVSKNATVAAANIKLTESEPSSSVFHLYTEYTGFPIGRIDFSRMFENCGSLETYSGFIPQYGITYEAMFNNCSSLEIDASEMFQNYYLEGESTTICYLSSVSASFEDDGHCEWDPHDRWDHDPMRYHNGFDSIMFHDVGMPPPGRDYHDVHSYFALVDGLGRPLQFLPNERINFSFSFYDDMRQMPPDRHMLDAYMFIGDRLPMPDHVGPEPHWRFGPSRIPNYHAPLYHHDGWFGVGGAFRPGNFSPSPNYYSHALIFGIRGQIPMGGRFWLGNFAIDSNLRHIRIGNFGDKMHGPEGFRFQYGRNQPQPVYTTAYNTNTCLDGYGMSSIAYMFNNCERMYASDDRFDAVSIVRRTAETLEYLGKEPSTSKECFENAFPKMSIATLEPLSSLSTVTYDLNGISQKCGIMRYCAGNTEDNDKYGIGTPYPKWLFGVGFLRYGGVFIDNPNEFFVIPYYRVENELGEVIDVAPHTSNAENMLLPETYCGPYAKSAHFDNMYDWMQHSINPFYDYVGPDQFGVYHVPESFGIYHIPSNHHMMRNWADSDKVLYGALVFDLEGNFKRKAYVGKWTEYVHTLGIYNGYNGQYDMVNNREHPVTPFVGRNTVDIPDVGTTVVKIQGEISGEKRRELESKGNFIYFTGKTGETNGNTTYYWKRSADTMPPHDWMFRYMRRKPYLRHWWY